MLSTRDDFNSSSSGRSTGDGVTRTSVGNSDALEIDTTAAHNGDTEDESSYDIVSGLFNQSHDETASISVEPGLSTRAVVIPSVDQGASISSQESRDIENKNIFIFSVGELPAPIEEVITSTRHRARGVDDVEWHMDSLSAIITLDDHSSSTASLTDSENAEDDSHCAFVLVEENSVELISRNDFDLLTDLDASIELDPTRTTNPVQFISTRNKMHLNESIGNLPSLLDAEDDEMVIEDQQVVDRCDDSVLDHFLTFGRGDVLFSCDESLNPRVFQQSCGENNLCFSFMSFMKTPPYYESQFNLLLPSLSVKRKGDETYQLSPRRSSKKQELCHLSMMVPNHPKYLPLDVPEIHVDEKEGGAISCGCQSKSRSRQISALSKSLPDDLTDLTLKKDFGERRDFLSAQGRGLFISTQSSKRLWKEENHFLVESTELRNDRNDKEAATLESTPPAEPHAIEFRSDEIEEQIPSGNDEVDDIKASVSEKPTPSSHERYNYHQVRFRDPVVSSVWEFPQIFPVEKSLLFYSFEDMLQFRLEYLEELELDDLEDADFDFLDACDAFDSFASQWYDVLVYLPEAMQAKGAWNF